MFLARNCSVLFFFFPEDTNANFRPDSTETQAVFHFEMAGEGQLYEQGGKRVVPLLRLRQRRH